MTGLEPLRRPSTSTDARLGVALVGVGRWGRHWLSTLARSEQIELCWVCEPALQHEPPKGVSVARTMDAALADPRVGALILATPLETHAALAERALLAGRHVLVEKPATTRLADLERLLRLAANQQRVLMTNHLLLHHPAFARLEQEVRAGTLGELRAITALRVSVGERPKESPWWTLAPHDLAMIDRLLPVLLDSEPSITWRGREQRVRLRRGASEARLGLSLCGRRKVRLFAVEGTRRSLLFDDLAAQPLTLHDATRSDLGGAFDDLALRRRLGPGRPLSSFGRPPLTRTLEALCARIAQGGGTTPRDAEHLRRVIGVLERGVSFDEACPPGEAS